MCVCVCVCVCVCMFVMSHAHCVGGRQTVGGAGDEQTTQPSQAWRVSESCDHHSPTCTCVHVCRYAHMYVWDSPMCLVYQLRVCVRLYKAGLHVYYYSDCSTVHRPLLSY